jgi:hypothetical protein
MSHIAPLLKQTCNHFSLFQIKAQGATLQNYNNELVKCIEDLREKREEVNRAILKEEEVCRCLK